MEGCGTCVCGCGGVPELCTNVYANLTTLLKPGKQLSEELKPLQILKK